MGRHRKARTRPVRRVVVDDEPTPALPRVRRRRGRTSGADDVVRRIDDALRENPPPPR